MQDARRTRVLVLLAFLGPLVWCFAGVLSGSRVLAYRDTAHFYYPLYHWLSHVWGQGEMPLWNPLENTGMPIAAEATAAVFYPGKLVFALPCSFTLRFHLYVVLHVVLAGVAIYCLARTWRVRPVGAGLAAIAYAFSGTVLFQYCNLVFLVGAAWLPLSLLAAEQMLRRRQPKWAILFGATLALMTLGGDPQGTYHAAMLTVLYALLIAFQHRKRKRLRLVRPRVGNATWLKTAPALLCLSAFTGLLLAAVQILPASVGPRPVAGPSLSVPDRSMKSQATCNETMKRRHRTTQPPAWPTRTRLTHMVNKYTRSVLAPGAGPRRSGPT